MVFINAAKLTAIAGLTRLTTRPQKQQLRLKKKKRIA